MTRPLASTPAVILLLAVALGGCGDGGSSTSGATAPVSSKHAPFTSKPSAPLSPAAAKAARETGRRACVGMSPLEAARHYEQAARRAGATREFAAFVAHPSPSAKNSPGFPRLVAALYATSLPARQRADAAAGCVEELASPSSGGQASSDRARRQGLPSSGSD